MKLFSPISSTYKFINSISPVNYRIHCYVLHCIQLKCLYLY